ncbi:RNA polymerase II-specific transcription factor-like protein [Microdochium nivale]|nr:RNA polymerase II-specific transcription factor-like protein [Microdochium nivale]
MEKSKARLRTKTGCLTCRRRRKKCDEASPICQACHRGGSSCQWPSPAQLVDRRFASHNGNTPPPPRHSPEPQLSYLALETALAHMAVSRGLEVVVRSHFMDKFYWLLLLPDCHPDFMHGWIADMQRLMLGLPSLRYSILACAAAHMHVADASPHMEQLALSYYAKAVGELSAWLNNIGNKSEDALQIEDNHGVLISVILLYVHGWECNVTFADIPKHVNAAARILAAKFFPSASTQAPSSQGPLIQRPFDRLAVESVIYQMFIGAAGLWSDHGCPGYEFDMAFWIQAEVLLDTSTLYPGKPSSTNSPVLGIPVACFRLALAAKQHYQSDHLIDEEVLMQTKAELAKLLEVVLASSSQPVPSLEPNKEQGEESDESCRTLLCYRDSAHLFVLISDLILEQLSTRLHKQAEKMIAEAREEEEAPTPMGSNNDKTQSGHAAAVPSAVPRSNSHLRQALRILRRHEADATWSAFYVGHWAVYTLGLFVQQQQQSGDSDEENGVEVVRRGTCTLGGSGPSAPWSRASAVTWSKLGLRGKCMLTTIA